MCDPLFQRVKETLQGLLNDSKFVFFIYKGFSDIYAEKNMYCLFIYKTETLNKLK